MIIALIQTVFAMYLIPVKGEVKHASNFDFSFDAR